MELKQKNHRLFIKLVITAVLMFGFCYLLVPFYQLICLQEGLNGRSSDTASEDTSVTIDKTREITVDFTTIIHSDLPFQFKPLTQQIKLHPGERKLVYFFAENDSGKQMVVQAIPSIMPGEAAKHLKKTECFCFTQQTFFPGEKADMPVYFYIDPDLPNNIHYVTLSYTLFNAEKYLNKKAIPVKGRIEL